MWKWLKERKTEVFLCIVVLLILLWAVSTTIVIADWLRNDAPKLFNQTKTTQHANCTLFDKIHADNMKILVGKIDEQGQIIATYRLRYLGLNKLGTTSGP
jgi:hypothetical protein